MAFHVNRYTGPMGPKPHFRQHQRMAFMPPPMPMAMQMPYGYASGMSMSGSLWQLGSNGQIQGMSDNLGNMFLAKLGNAGIDAGLNWLLGPKSS